MSLYTLDMAFNEDPDILSGNNQEAEGGDSREQYISQINQPIELRDKIYRYPTGRKIMHFSVANVSATGPVNWREAYDINLVGTHTSGRRGGFEDFLTQGIKPFGTPFNEDESYIEVPAVVCGYLKDNNVIQDSETLERNYGDIFNPESTGFVVVLGPEIKNTDGYEVVGQEARIKVDVTRDMTKAIIVGNDTMEARVIDALKRQGITLPVIRLNRTEVPL